MGNPGATLSQVSWVIAAYGIANVIIVPMIGWLSNQFGRRQYFAGSVILFTVASVLCGNSTNIWELVFFRFLQGRRAVPYWLLLNLFCTKHFRQNSGLYPVVYMAWVW
jgi:MFS family permease